MEVVLTNICNLVFKEREKRHVTFWSTCQFYIPLKRFSSQKNKLSKLSYLYRQILIIPIQYNIYSVVPPISQQSDMWTLYIDSLSISHLVECKVFCTLDHLTTVQDMRALSLASLLITHTLKFVEQHHFLSLIPPSSFHLRGTRQIGFPSLFR